MGAEAYIHARLVALAAAAGAVDAASFLGLKGVFTANQTGNTVLLGIAFSRGDWDSVVRSGVAVAGFALGVLLAALALRRAARGWSPTITAVSAVQALALGVLAALWWPAPTLVLIALAATAMGAQSAATLHVGVPGVTTTFVTGTITRIVSELAGRRRTFRERTPALAWAAYLAGAIAGGLLERGWSARAAMAAAAAATCAVALVSASPAARRRSRRRR